ncbi:unnamed protein product [Parascedosporium putredinis]|uniref:Uncharacterized protein n=1 Tax=Parascedosporium putredinis TaxID=1442378 RepID=A0A9P1GUM2_9PEZI|nr:unnamed protein product [Parascedosporium putredinis]CAI7987413.1 unnamed protein product [Parascedosporium putredinis]
MMYPVGQAAAQNPYDASQQFPGRQPGTMSIMPSEVPQYFQSDGERPRRRRHYRRHSHQAQPTNKRNKYQLSGTLPSAGAGLASSQTAASGVGVDEADYSVPATGAGLEERWADYQARLATVFQDIRSGSLKRASLNVDDRTLHADRLKLWNDFNHAWLGLLQRQKDMAEGEQKPQGAETLLSKDDMEKMGKELVRLCDGVERHGLVDYQYGVWEEQIITVLTEALDLYDSSPSGAS